MKTNIVNLLRNLCLTAVAAVGAVHPASSQDILVKPQRGGGIDTNPPPMIHADIFYDYGANAMRVTVDTNYGLPKLVPLPPGYAFDSRSNYAVLDGKAYNFQYAWNPGGAFTPPAGAAVWIERLQFSPGLENYDGPGNKMENPPRPYAPILGTDGSPAIWKWYGRMAHNAFAIRNPTTNVLTAQFRVYFGDAVTGSREAFLDYDDATVELVMTVEAVTLVKPQRGGGIDTNPPPMIHADIFYDYGANAMRVTVDTNYGLPKLVPLPPGYAFDSRSNYAVLDGKAYNFQYAWNPGGAFTPPAGAAVWIERLQFSPGLENYDGPGNKMENPPRPYAPILGTDGSPAIWKWYGRMAHNAFAIRNPTTNVLTAQFRVYFGDAVTGSREAFLDYDDATVELVMTVEAAPAPLALRFGAVDEAPNAAMCLLAAGQLVTNSASVVNLRRASAGPFAGRYEVGLVTIAVPATTNQGGPLPNHAALGSCPSLQLVSLTGPPRASLGYWEVGEFQPRFTVPVGTSAGTYRFLLSENRGVPGSDPAACIRGRHFTVDQPGLYCLGFRVVDTSTNGPGSGPIHAPSELYCVYLQAGCTVNSLARNGSTLTAIFGGEPGKTFYLERAIILAPGADWQTIDGPLAGASCLQTLSDAAAVGTQGFYRLRTTVP